MDKKYSHIHIQIAKFSYFYILDRILQGNCVRVIYRQIVPLQHTPIKDWQFGWSAVDKTQVLFFFFFLVFLGLIG